ncbi:hypothetical protein E5288_WYG018047 [Bos mutus]|uniref:Potassium voltage-gated channel subfamily E member 3 n=1 Tax=Bos mutus TaxID=72004 RepID=A0A6B0RZJ7_9CETA|nr:hypothetical protein [Bos mutus]
MSAKCEDVTNCSDFSSILFLSEAGRKPNGTCSGSNLLCRPGPDNLTEEKRASLPGRNDNSYMYILFVMFLFAATVGSLILGYTRSRKVDKRSDPYHVYIKNRVSML